MENKKHTISFNTLPDIYYVNTVEPDQVWAKVAHQGKQHELMHVLRGNVEVVFENENVSFSGGAGSTIITPADTLHRDVFDFDAGVKVLMIHFYWEQLSDYLSVMDNLLSANVTGEADFQQRRLFDDIRLDSGIDEADKALANARLMTLLMLFYRGVAGTHRAVDKTDGHSWSSLQGIVDEAKKYLEKNYSQPIRLEEVAKALGVSPFYLSRIFNRESDFSLFEYLTEVRINAAKKLLREERYIIGDIAQMVGFESSNYFSKVFRKHVGCNPTQYR
jgi:AraC-like DNA-binding protein